MEFSVQQIAHLVGGEVEGDGTQAVHTVAKIQEGKPGAISFLANLKYEPFIYQTKSSAVLVSKDFETKAPVSAVLIRVDDPYEAFAALLEEYNKLRQAEKQGYEAPYFIDDSATLGEGLYVGAFAYVGKNVHIGDQVKVYPQVYIGDNVTIGEGTIIYAGAKIYADTKIGAHCTIHAGAVVGSDGFGFAPREDGSYRTVPQLGNVILEDHVSIGANATIDCATMGTTTIEAGVKIDNLVQIAHNVRVGAHTVIASQSGVSGSTQIGKYCVLAGQVGVVGHIEIADKTIIGAQSGVSKSFPEGNQTLLGSPAYPYRESTRIYAVSRRLPEMKQKVDQLEKKIEELQAKLSDSE